MDKRRNNIIKFILLWASLVFYKMYTVEAEMISNMTLGEKDTGNVGDIGLVWSSWGSWSACSRTCGGGVAVQERHCLPRDSVRGRSIVSRPTLAPPMITVRITRQVPQNADCSGEPRRYHECNTAPCAGITKDSRGQQCAAFDRRPFRGRFYTWVPYIDGNAPCTLNCRPLGHHFYASLALVADGTPCTRPGFRAICVQGTCKVVGRDSVLASTSSRDLHCGRRLVSGLFSRPRLPLGYSYVATVPRGACRLNISVMVSSENYIALKLVNDSYIVNGDFAVSAPGSYEAAGTRFVYTRLTGQDSVYAQGPLLQPVDIMILYTQPNPRIKYEYFTESIPGEPVELESNSKIIPDMQSSGSSKHSRRHHNLDTPLRINSPSEDSETDDNDRENIVGSRKFIWKVLSFSQCTRSCGGGTQLGKFRCVEASSNGADREVSTVHCAGSPPTSRRRRCGSGPCPPKWRSAAWSTCPSCGPANRTRIVGCVQDHSHGITKVSDIKCPSPKPSTMDLCRVPDCNNMNSSSNGVIMPSQSGRKSNPNVIDAFHEGPVYTVSVNSTGAIGPEYNFNSVGGWLYTEWSDCVGWCVGGGIETRGIRCADPAGCAPRRAPEAYRSCTPKISCDKHEGQWFTGEWSTCSSSCSGRQIRGVLCVGASGRHLRESACKGPRPENERECGADCNPIWYFSDWGQCTGDCDSETGVEHRTVWCARGDGRAAPRAACAPPRPRAERACARCAAAAPAPPRDGDVTIESQILDKSDANENPKDNEITADCKDKLVNCQLAVQARLCHYNYYIKNCCSSCQGR